MKPEYLHSIEVGNNLLEVLNPATGEIHAVISILDYDVEMSTKNLVVNGIDMTDFFVQNQYTTSGMVNFPQKLTAFIQKNKPCIHKFSSHFPFTVYSGQ